MNAKWVVNASPLILLAKVQRLGLLVELAQTVVIPVSVAAEIEAGPENDPARGWLTGEGVEFIRPDLVLAPGIAAWDLGGGEQAVLSWAFHHRDYEAILDDRAARKCARILGIDYRGTLGVVLAAKRSGLIPEAKPVFDELISAGLLVDRELDNVGEVLSRLEFAVAAAFQALSMSQATRSTPLSRLAMTDLFA